MRIFINHIYERWDWERSTLNKRSEKEEDLNHLLELQRDGFIKFCSD